jgi:CHAT domain-containing protein
MRQAQRQIDEDAVEEDASLMVSIKRDQKVLGSFYQHLLAPVEAHLEGATEVLIIPHKELFFVPWAALFDSQTGYLIERHVLRVAPSVPDRTARAARGTVAARGTNGGGHVAGNERTGGEGACAGGG